MNDFDKWQSENGVRLWRLWKAYRLTHQRDQPSYYHFCVRRYHAENPILPVTDAKRPVIIRGQ